MFSHVVFTSLLCVVSSIAPTWVPGDHMENKTALAGASMYMVCDVPGNGSVMWYYKSTVINREDPVFTITEEGHLFIYPLQPVTHDGIFSCVKECLDGTGGYTIHNFRVGEYVVAVAR